MKRLSLLIMTSVCLATVAVVAAPAAAACSPTQIDGCDLNSILRLQPDEFIRECLNLVEDLIR